MNIAVVGAGIFGLTTAFTLARAGHKVTLFEKGSEIGMGASKVNQLRLHLGYHYPRSQTTVDGLRSSVPDFISEYGPAVRSPKSSIYAIPRSGSLVSPDDYTAFCCKNSLSLKSVKLDYVKNVDAFSVKENLINYDTLLKKAFFECYKAGVTVRLFTRFGKDSIYDYDHVVNCTYSSLNDLLEEDEQSEYQFELCEKILVTPPKSLRGRSIVIIDGPFMCIDPLTADDDDSLMGNVVHAVISTHVGKVRQSAREFGHYVDGRIHNLPKMSRFNDFITSGSEFIPDIVKCRYVGSMYTFRVVLPRVESTDERPTLVRKINHKVTNVFSGKIDTCVSAAKEVKRILEC